MFLFLFNVYFLGFKALIWLLSRATRQTLVIVSENTERRSEEPSFSPSEVFLVQRWACVRTWSSPTTRPPPLPLPPSRCVCVGQPRSQQSPSPGASSSTTEMAAKVCRSVLLLSRSGGAVAGSLPAVVVSPQRHQRHVGPVSPRTCVCETGESERGAGW